MFAALQSATCQAVQEQAQNMIGNAEGETRAATDNLLFYWNNISDSARYSVLTDIQKAWQYRWAAKGSFDVASYNESLEEAYWATFVAGRATYRIFLDIANTNISTANLTLKSIPSYIPQPTDATDKLTQAYGEFQTAYLEDVFDSLPSTEMAPIWINAMHNAENKLYWDHETTVIFLANQATKEAENWTQAHEDSLQQVIKEQTSGVSNAFYYQLLVPYLVEASTSLIFLVPITRKLHGWFKKKSNRNVIWNGNLWDKRWNRDSIVPTLGVLTIFFALLWGWIDAMRGLSRTYDVHIPTELLDTINVVLFVQIILLAALYGAFALNRFRWQKKTGMLFTILLVLELVLSLTVLYVGWHSLGQIHSAVIS